MEDHINPLRRDLDLEDRSDAELEQITRRIADIQRAREAERRREGKKLILATAKEYGLRVSFEPEKPGRKPRSKS